ncbi:MAG: 3-phosphoserine/phosphohydroxythreonine transaminase [Saprospiraceae bacterium]|nr:3-phosphoserine/phosphohydroxythreonine transaminase [Saprospiraceae bacterium]
MTKKHNFYAGPAILPQEVLEGAQAAIREFAGTGLSLLEISHRSKAFEAVMEEAGALVLELMGLDNSYAVLFLTGGASSQFYMVPMNFLNEGDRACYVNSGVWAAKAIREASLFGKVEVLASSESSAFQFIPKDFAIPQDAAYFHITSNNTIYGTQYHRWPEAGEVPLFCDMSSDIFSRKLDFSKFSLIYAGAQKNLGPAGVTLVVLRRSMLDRVQRKLPSMLQYRTHAENGSMYNTPPVFPIYVSLLTLKWIRNLGLDAIEAQNLEKATRLYDEISRNTCFFSPVAEEDRSWMNVVFRTTRPELEAVFLDRCKEAHCVGLAGHRSAGGFRASLYNALGLESVEVLIQLMREFERAHG